MKPGAIARHRAALRRRELSRPIRLALQDNLISDKTSVLDYGCGLGDDVEQLQQRGITCAGWDPVHRPQGARSESNVVNLGYVLNVIEDPGERVRTLLEAWALAKDVLIVAARLHMEARADAQAMYGDGYITRIGTFQKYYEQHELRAFLEEALGVAPVAAGPGVFYSFRNTALREAFLASRYRRRVSAPRVRKSDGLYEQYKELLAPLVDFVSSRGRVPMNEELPQAPEIIEKLGSLKQAFALIRSVTGAEHWEAIGRERRDDLLIYLALSRFEGRPRFSELPEDVRYDIRAFFSTYSKACVHADELLISAGDRASIDRACRELAIGKQTPTALYVHASVVSLLPTILRVYEGCARGYIGTVEDANLVKIHRDFAAISYLSYPDFERDPHPALKRSVLVEFSTPRVKQRDYAESANPPILHRKEEFVAPDHPLREKFARLTQQEERWGLYVSPSLIGTQKAWEELVARYGFRYRGHRLVKA